MGKIIKNGIVLGESNDGMAETLDSLQTTIQEKTVSKDDILSTLEECISSTDTNNVASASALKELNTKFGDLKFGYDKDTGYYGYYIGDTFWSFRHWHIAPGADVPDPSLKDNQTYTEDVYNNNKDKMGCYGKRTPIYHSHLPQVQGESNACWTWYSGSCTQPIAERRVDSRTINGVTEYCAYVRCIAWHSKWGSWTTSENDANNEAAGMTCGGTSSGWNNACKKTTTSIEGYKWERSCDNNAGKYPIKNREK